jgi:hypothetical protein
VFETYRMLGAEREAELLREAQRSRRPAGHPRGGLSLATSLIVLATIGLATFGVWIATATL